MMIKSPYLLFLGDAPDLLAAKVAKGIVDWRPGHCVGQLRLSGCDVDLGLKNLTIEEAVAAGAQTMVVGVANRGGVISEAWTKSLRQALEAGLDLAAGLHHRLAHVAELSDTAGRLGRRLFDVRHPDRSFDVGTGKRRSGKRLLSVGTDCSVGKMYTTLALERDMRARGIKADFRATGQTGILIVGSGVSVDAVVSDFISGAVEHISPENDDDHWDIIEGQGSLFHASFAGVSMGLLHGAQPDVLVMCHEPTRTHMRGLPHYALPAIGECIEANLAAAHLTNPQAAFAGISVNTSQMDKDRADAYLASLEKEFGLPAIDAFRDGTDRIIDNLPA